MTQLTVMGLDPGTHNTGKFDIMSYGPDAVQGGGDDIGNWEVAK